EMFGKTMRISDELMIRYYELLTTKTVDEIEELKQGISSGKLHPRDIKVALARLIVERFHGAQAARGAETEYIRIFVDRGLPDDMPEYRIPAGDMTVCRLLVDLNLAKSNGEGRRLIQGGAVEVRAEKVSDPQLTLSLSSGEDFIVRVGKKRFAK